MKLKDMKAHNRAVTEIISIPSENRVISFSAEGKTILIHALDTHEILSHIEAHEDEIVNVLYHNEKRIFISASKDKTIKMWDLQSGTLLKQIKYEHEVIDLAIFPDGRFLLSATLKGVFLWNIDLSLTVRSWNIIFLNVGSVVPLDDGEHFIVLSQFDVKLYNIYSFDSREIIKMDGCILNATN